jgi:hypothetical protein
VRKYTILPRLATQRTCTTGTVHILLQVLLNAFKNSGSGSDRILAVGRSKWRFQSTNSRSNCCHSAHSVPYSPNTTPLRSIQQHKTTPTSFAKYHHFDSYTVAQARCYAPSQVHPNNPSLSLLLLSTRRSHWLFTYSDHTDLLYCKEQAYWRRTFFMI